MTVLDKAPSETELFDRAKKALRRKASSDALALAGQGLSRFPESLRLKAIKLKALVQLGQVQDALELGSSLPIAFQAAALLRPMVDLLIDIRATDQAGALLDAVPQEDRSSLDYQIANLSFVQTTQGREAALDLAEGYRSDFPDRMDLALKVASLLIGLNRAGDAIAVVEDLQDKAQDPRAAIILARALFLSGKHAQALEILRQDYRTSNRPGHILFLAQVLDDLFDRDFQLEVLEHGVSRFPNHVKLNAKLWRTLVMQGKRSEALSRCVRFLAENSGSPRAQLAAARFKRSQGLIEDCEASIETASKLLPDLPAAAAVRAQNELENKDPEKALSVIDKNTDLLATSPGLRHLQAKAHFAMGEWQRALSELEGIVADFPEFQDSKYLLAQYSRLVGMPDAAIQVLSSDKSDIANHIMRRCEIEAEIALDDANASAALAIIERAMHLPNPRPALWVLKSRAELMNGDVQSAWQSHLRSIDLRLQRDVTGNASNKKSKSIRGQILNEFRLLGQNEDLTASRDDRDPRHAARIFKKNLDKDPGSTAWAISLLTAQRRLGDIKVLESPPAASGADDRIPRKIFQFWDQPVPPEGIQDLMTANRTLNPEYVHTCFDAQSAFQYIREKGETEALKAYRLAPHPAAKSDLFRLVVLWHEGGIYIDADDRCLRPLSEIIDHRAAFLGYQESPMTIGNNFLAVRPKDPIIRAALEEAIPAFNGPRGESIWLSTGPGVISRAVARLGSDDDGRLRADVRIIPVGQIRRFVALHVHVPYKSTARGWKQSFLRHEPGSAPRPSA